MCNYKRNLPLAEQFEQFLLCRLQTTRAVRDKNRNIRLFQHTQCPADALRAERALIVNTRCVDDNHRTDREQFHRLLHRIGGRALDIGNNGQCLSGHAVYHAGFARIAQAEKADVYALTGGLCVQSHGKPSLKTEITAIGAADILDMLGCNFAYLIARDFFKFFLNQLHADAPGVFACVIDQILCQRHQCVRVAAVEDLAALAQAHETVAGAPLTVAGGAERRNKPKLHEPVNNLIERALIGYIKLLRVVRTLLFLVATDRGTGSTADLRNTQTKRPLTHLLALAGGDDHAGVRHGNADARDNLCEQLVAQAVVEYVRIDIVRA